MKGFLNVPNARVSLSNSTLLILLILTLKTSVVSCRRPTTTAKLITVQFNKLVTFFMALLARQCWSRSWPAIVTDLAKRSFVFMTTRAWCVRRLGACWNSWQINPVHFRKTVHSTCTGEGQYRVNLCPQYLNTSRSTTSECNALQSHNSQTDYFSGTSTFPPPTPPRAQETICQEVATSSHHKAWLKPTTPRPAIYIWWTKGQGLCCQGIVSRFGLAVRLRLQWCFTSAETVRTTAEDRPPFSHSSWALAFMR